MRITITSGSRELNKVHLDAVAILKYFLGTDNRIETLVLCRTEGTEITATDFELYQALGSLTSYGLAQHAKLVKFLENVDVLPYRLQTGNRKKILTHETVDALRQSALRTIGTNDTNGGN